MVWNRALILGGVIINICHVVLIGTRIASIAGRVPGHPRAHSGSIVAASIAFISSREKIKFDIGRVVCYGLHYHFPMVRASR